MTITIARRAGTRRARRNPTPPAARLAAVGGALALALAALATTAVVLPTMIAGSGHSDLMVFRASAAAWLTGRDPYAPLPLPNLNHPAFLVLAVPLVRLSPVAAYVTWAAATVGVYVLTLALAARVARPDLAAWQGVATAALAASCPGLLASILWGQVGVFLGLGTVAVWLLLRRDRALAAGIVAGILVVLKPYLLPLALVFLARQRQRGLAGLAVGGVGLSLAALPLVGLDTYVDWIYTLLHVVGAGGPGSISLAGATAYLMHRVAAPLPAIEAFQVGTTLVMAALVLLAPRRGVPGADRDVPAALLLALLGSPLGWAHYTATLVPVGAALVRRRYRLARPATALALGATALLWLPGALTFGGLPVDPLQTLALLALLAAVLWPHVTSRPAT
ncbi:MAG TPA: glycosyltransferase family 87 protein [Thermomicrobiales bacterium]|nr:glycosyltransferase family 87 protein [Thermomicrobiales bacterium]